MCGHMQMTHVWKLVSLWVGLHERIELELGGCREASILAARKRSIYYLLATCCICAKPPTRGKWGLNSRLKRGFLNRHILGVLVQTLVWVWVWALVWE